MSADMQAAKAALRSRLKQRLRAMTAQQRGAGSIAACRRALQEGLFPGASTVLLYSPMLELGEVDLTTLAEALASRGGMICVPRVDWQAGTMSPVRVSNLTSDLIADTSSGRVCRMARSDAPAVPAAHLRAIVVPGLGFDLQGNRIGRGAGYYDRFLKGLGPGVSRVALAFDEQIVDSIPVEAFDERVHVIVTPTRTLRVGNDPAC